MTTTLPSSLAQVGENAEPLPTSAHIPNINFRASSTIPFIVTRPPATYMSSPLVKLEMGLAVETWLHILSFLSRSPLALLACALTCRYLRGPSQDMIKHLFCPAISTYHDLDTLIEEIRESPALARVIRKLDIRAKEDMTSIPVFSVIPFRLTRILTRLETLQIGYFPTNGRGTITGLSCAWSFYGRAFHSVTTLEFRDVTFPSFFDFTSLIISFPALATLLIRDVGCRRQEVTTSVKMRPRKPAFILERLTLSESISKGNTYVRFLQTLAWWLVEQRGTSVETLNIDYTSPIRWKLLQGLQRNLQRLELHCPVSSLPRDLGFADLQFPLLTHITIYDVRSEGIPWLRAKLPLIFPSIEYRKALEITVVHLETDTYSSAWKVLNVVIFAYQFLARRTSKSRIIRPPTGSPTKSQSPEEVIIFGLSKTPSFILFQVVMGQKTIEGGYRHACPPLSA